MSKRLILSVAVLVLLAFAVTYAGTTVYVKVSPPDPKVEKKPDPPNNNAVWIGGYWNWDGGKYVWIGGYWEKNPQGTWVAGHWKNTKRGYVWVPGHWKRSIFKDGGLYVLDSPPPPKAEKKPKRPGKKAVWIDGHWRWNGEKYTWIGGHWVKAPKGKWIKGQWKKTKHGHIWVAGRWKK